MFGKMAAIIFRVGVSGVREPLKNDLEDLEKMAEILGISKDEILDLNLRDLSERLFDQDYYVDFELSKISRRIYDLN